LNVMSEGDPMRAAENEETFNCAVGDRNGVAPGDGNCKFEGASS